MDDRSAIADELLQEIWKKRQHLSLTYFSAISGRKSAGKLMIVGRAVNGWTTEFCLSELEDKERRHQIIRGPRSPAASDECPMKWVRDGWNTGQEKYNTASSAFWQTAKQLVERLYEVTDADWASHLTWTNLYKVSPAEGGNPTGTLEELQVPICARLLASEVRQYHPGKIVFFTGTNWANPFLGAVKVSEFHEQVGSVSYGRWPIDLADKGVPTVIAPHPQGKKRDDLVNWIVTAFEKLGGA